MCFFYFYFLLLLRGRRKALAVTPHLTSCPMYSFVCFCAFFVVFLKSWTCTHAHTHTRTHTNTYCKLRFHDGKGLLFSFAQLCFVSRRCRLGCTIATFASRTLYLCTVRVIQWHPLPNPQMSNQPTVQRDDTLGFTRESLVDASVFYFIEMVPCNPLRFAAFTCALTVMFFFVFVCVSCSG